MRTGIILYLVGWDESSGREELKGNGVWEGKSCDRGKGKLFGGGGIL